MWELDYKGSWVPKNWCFWTAVLEKTLEKPLDCKEIQPVNSKGTLSSHGKDECWSWSSNTLATWCEELTHWKRSWCWERLKAGEVDDRGWDGWMASPINIHEFEQALGVGVGQGSLSCCSPWGHKKSDLTDKLNWIPTMVFITHSILNKWLRNLQIIEWADKWMDE